MPLGTGGSTGGTPAGGPCGTPDGAPKACTDSVEAVALLASSADDTPSPDTADGPVGEACGPEQAVNAPAARTTAALSATSCDRNMKTSRTGATAPPVERLEFFPLDQELICCAEQWQCQ